MTKKKKEIKTAKKKKKEWDMNKTMIANFRLEFLCSNKNEYFVVMSSKYA